MKKALGPIVILLVVAGIVGYSAYTKKQTPTPTTSTEKVTQVSYDCVAGQTAYDLLAATHTVVANDTDFGKQVMAIDGSEPVGNQYWAFYTNGALATVGADAYTCTGSEPIRWQLDSF